MRILYFTRSYTPHDRRFLCKLAETHHELSYLALEEDRVPLERRSLPARVRVVNEPLSRGRVSHPDDVLPLLPIFSEILGQLGPDAIHAGPIQTCGYLAALSSKGPLLLMSWGSDILFYAERDDVWRHATRVALRRAARLFCDCDAVRHKVCELADFEEDRIVQFPWGVDTRAFSPSSAETGLRDSRGRKGGFVVLSTRSWEPVYGIDVLLKAFAIAHRQRSEMRLVLLAGGSLEPEVTRIIEECKLCEVVERPGMISNDLLPGVFRSADVYMSCTYSDGSSISLLEALATGLPAIVTDAPGNREWVTPGRNGWLAAAGEPQAFADCLLAAAEMGPTERLAMRQFNRSVAESRADWDLNSQKLLSTYRELEAGSLPHRIDR
jgi:glycosyltransferase involved in cell wall biosynthesis